MSAITPAVVVDIHSHLYPATWISLLRARGLPPYIDTTANTLVNRPRVSGKPLLPDLYDVATKIEFMDQHGIDISVLSLGNPWLDFLTTAEERAGVGDVARKINWEMESMCSAHEGRLYYFAVLPLTALLATVIEAIQQVATHAHCKGVVMGYAGFGAGIDDTNFMPVFEVLARLDLPIFFHPNYGLPMDVFGPCCGSYGQILPVSMGFTTETTVAFTRMYLANIFDKTPTLQIVLPHAGGTLSSVVGRIEACIANDKTYQSRLPCTSPRSVREVLGQNVYLDGITFDRIALQAAADTVGYDRIMFGTDHPLFPSLREDNKYDAMVRNRNAAEECFGPQTRAFHNFMGANAVTFLKLRGSDRGNL